MTTTNLKPLTLDLCKEKLPKTTSLIYVDYRDSFDENPDLIQDYITGGDEMDDKVFDWYSDSSWMSVDGYINELKQDLVAAGYDEDEVEAYIETHEDVLRDIVQDRSDDTPIDDLFGNTRQTVCYYDTGLQLDSLDYTDAVSSMKSIKKTLGILQKDKTYDDKILQMVKESWYGGQVVIYFTIDNNQDMFRETSLSEDKHTIKFNNYYIAIISTSQGAGGHCRLDHEVAFEYKKDNLFVCQCDKYSYTFEVCGMDRDWCEDTKYTIIKGLSKARKVDESIGNANKEKEKEYIKVFKAGGCSFGDSDIRRHDTYYENNYPCGLKCKNCMRFWID